MDEITDVPSWIQLYFFIWFSFWFHFQNRCGVHNSWLTAARASGTCCAFASFVWELLLQYWRCLFHHSIRLWRWNLKAFSHFNYDIVLRKVNYVWRICARLQLQYFDWCVFVYGSVIHHIVAHNTTANSVNSIFECTFRFMRVCANGKCKLRTNFTFI